MVHGTNANVLLMEADSTLEDSSSLTEEFGKKLATNLVTSRSVMLSSNMILHSSVKVGDTVKNTDYLAIFEESGGLEIFDKYDDETQELLSKLNRKTPKAKYTGTIVDIDIYYSCDLETVHDSVKSVILPLIKSKKDKAKFASESRQKTRYTMPAALPVGTKYKGVEFGEDTILLVYYISHEVDHVTGDKLVIGNQLKSTTMGVMKVPPVTESGVQIDCIFSSAVS